MRRVFAAMVTGIVCAATTAAGQWAGLPVWNRPGGHSGMGLSADYGRPDLDAGHGDAFGGRAWLGIGMVTVGAGVGAWKPDSAASGGADWITSVGATAALRLIGGSLLPFAVNLAVGAARTGRSRGTVGDVPATATVTASLGLSTVLPLPGLRVEAYGSPGLRRRAPSGADARTAFGWVIGADLDFGGVGFHVAYDAEEGDGILGVGVHVAFRPH